MPRPLFRRHDANTAGRDFVVGDIHGHFYLLEALLTHVAFDERADRVFSVGDLVDHGPECERTSEFLLKPWFNAIRGNHEQMLLRGAHIVDWAPQDMRAASLWISNGGDWFFRMSLGDGESLYCDIQMLPLAAEVALPDGGTAGLVHADVLADSWAAVRACLTDESPNPDFARSIEHLVWSRSRANDVLGLVSEGSSGGTRAGDLSVSDIDVVFFGHTSMPLPARAGNTRWIDSGVSRGGSLSLAELAVDGHVWSMTTDCLSVTQGWTTQAAEDT
ncbi:metallophosphoesterase [Salinisphaera sp. P385]|uniref:Metallophosphoesterase n=1 Tax=Spectribacter acetivorans TaxID=3075603 RepID=A0ABU3BBS3_9GAMM|nr:metallophosphoesterase [Salinisphaera sp. P385]MDT0619578.1 metallophosphoesterase [Salinisphaera sp. P385]